MNDELYPELEDYIWRNYYYVFSTETEKKAEKHHHEIEQRKYRRKIGLPKSVDDDTDISTDREVLRLLDNGFENFKKVIIGRIFNEHFGELELNLCPACRKIARTPLANQCRFCYHDWH